MKKEETNKSKENSTKTIPERGKISQFHLDYINKMIDKILSGEINIKEALELLKKASINNGEEVIQSKQSIKKCIEIILKDRPEELKLYREQIKKNIGKRNPNKGNIGNAPVGLYQKKERKFEQRIIEEYLPLINRGQITLGTVERELSTSCQTINRVIEDFYLQNNNIEGLIEYKKNKKSNTVPIEKKENARKKREEVAQYSIVTCDKFMLLPPEQQEKQIIMKIRSEELKEELREKDNVQTYLVSEDIIKAKIDRIIEYFKSKNDNDFGKIYFSEEEIRYMIFRYTTLINRTNKILDEKLRTLTSYPDIDKKTAYNMIKSFPAIIGYETLRTKRQLDLLEKEGLVDVVTSVPRNFMNSPNLMYALIEYAKERYGTTNLKNIDIKQIFISNKLLKRRYGISYDELKAKYPYIGEEEQDGIYTITHEEIGKATYKSRQKSKEASNILAQAVRNNEI